MSELPFLKKYSGQTTDELISLEGEYRTDSLAVAFESAVSKKAEQVGLDVLTEEERVVLAVEALEREINNGGYRAFFDSWAEYAPIVVDALNLIGCTETAKLTQQVIDSLGITTPVTTEAIRRLMEYADERSYEEMSERLHEFDQQYYETAGDLSGPLFEFIKTNRHKINLTGQPK